VGSCTERQVAVGLTVEDHLVRLVKLGRVVSSEDAGGKNAITGVNTDVVELDVFGRRAAGADKE
jgi:hypothetical protein